MICRQRQVWRQPSRRRGGSIGAHYRAGHYGHCLTHIKFVMLSTWSAVGGSSGCLRWRRGRSLQAGHRGPSTTGGSTYYLHGVQKAAGVAAAQPLPAVAARALTTGQGALEAISAQLQAAARAYTPISHLLWGLWGLIQVSKTFNPRSAPKSPSRTSCGGCGASSRSANLKPWIGSDRVR